MTDGYDTTTEQPDRVIKIGRGTNGQGDKVYHLPDEGDLPLCGARSRNPNAGQYAEGDGHYVKTPAQLPTFRLCGNCKRATEPTEGDQPTTQPEDSSGPTLGTSDHLGGYLFVLADLGVFDLPEELRDRSPKAVAIYAVLEAEGPARLSDLMDRVAVSTATIQHALDELQEHDLIVPAAGWGTNGNRPFRADGPEVVR